MGIVARCPALSAEAGYQYLAVAKPQALPESLCTAHHALLTTLGAQFGSTPPQRPRRQRTLMRWKKNKERVYASLAYIPLPGDRVFSPLGTSAAQLTHHCHRSTLTKLSDIPIRVGYLGIKLVVTGDRGVMAMLHLPQLVDIHLCDIPKVIFLFSERP